MFHWSVRHKQNSAQISVVLEVNVSCSPQSKPKQSMFQVPRAPLCLLQLLPLQGTSVPTWVTQDEFCLLVNFLLIKPCFVFCVWFLFFHLCSGLTQSHLISFCVVFRRKRGSHSFICFSTDRHSDRLQVLPVAIMSWICCTWFLVSLQKYISVGYVCVELLDQRIQLCSVIQCGRFS